MGKTDLKATGSLGALSESVDRAIGLFVLNVLTVLCCIPLITIGASLAAMHTVALKLARNEEGYVAKDFFKAFRSNLKIGIKASILLIVVTAVAVADFYAISLLDVWFADVARVLLIVFCIFAALTLTFLFPVMAKFEAGLRDTIKNAFKFAFSHFGITVAMLVLNLIPWVICYFFNVLGPILFMLGISVPAYFGALMYSDRFRRLEEAFEDNKTVQQGQYEG